MITYIWSGTSLLFIFLLPFSLIYGLITAMIRWSYRRGWKKTYRFPVPIVVIGNLTVGGNGKTPMVVWLVTQLQERGWYVGVVTRGYGRKIKRGPLLLDEDTTSDQCGDEPLLIWKKTRAPVAVAKKRPKAVAALLRLYPLDIIITDDGLQHYALGRDIEWVVIDGERRFGNGWWLPAGPMRERAKRLKRVQAVIVNGGKVYPGEVSMKLVADNAVNLLTGERCALVELMPVVVIAGIGNPKRFFSTVRMNGVIPNREVSFNDHKIYQPKMLNILAKNEENLLMTEKDAVKCIPFARKNWWYLPVKATLPEEVKEILLLPIEQLICHYKKKLDQNTRKIPVI